MKNLLVKVALAATATAAAFMLFVTPAQAAGRGTVSETVTAEEAAPAEATEEMAEAEPAEEVSSEEVAEEVDKEVEADAPVEETSDDDTDAEAEEEVSEAKGFIPEAEDGKTAELVEDHKTGFIPENEDGEVKADIELPETVKVEHKGVLPQSVNEYTDAEGKKRTAYCNEEKNNHPDYEGTDYAEEAAEAGTDYDANLEGSFVEYTKSINDGANKEEADLAIQALIWEKNGSQDNQEALLSVTAGQNAVDLYNRYKAQYGPKPEGWTVSVKVLKPAETSEFGNYQVLLSFECTETPEEEKVVPPTPEPKPEPQPEPQPETDEEVPQTGDAPVLPFVAVGIVFLGAALIASRKRA